MAQLMAARACRTTFSSRHGPPGAAGERYAVVCVSRKRVGFCKALNALSQAAAARIERSHDVSPRGWVRPGFCNPLLTAIEGVLPASCRVTLGSSPSTREKFVGVVAATMTAEVAPIGRLRRARGLISLLMVSHPSKKRSVMLLSPQTLYYMQQQNA